jgi:hypothetical protein
MKDYLKLLLQSTLTFAYVIVFGLTFFALGYLSFHYQLERPELKLSPTTARVLSGVFGWLYLILILSSLLILWKLKRSYLKRVTIALCLISLPLLISMTGRYFLPKLPDTVSEYQKGDFRIRKELFYEYPCTTKIWRSKDKYDPYNPPDEEDIEWILTSQYSTCK